MIVDGKDKKSALSKVKMWRFSLLLQFFFSFFLLVSEMWKLEVIITSHFLESILDRSPLGIFGPWTCPWFEG